MGVRYSICVSNREAAKADVLQGTLDIIILQTLATLGPSHGYTIASRLEQVSGGRVQLNMGTLYPGLMRLEQRGAVRGTWGVTDNNRKARFYAITAAGGKLLAAERTEWNRMVGVMRAILSEQP
jgi:transcriptional regulator